MADGREICDLSAEELMAELRALGLRTGPITPTTRKIFERKLARVRGEQRASKIQEIQADSEPQDTGSLQLQLQDQDTTDFGAVSCESSQNFDAVSDSPVFFYGVCFDSDNANGNVFSLPAVFVHKQQALQAVRKLKQHDARFKACKTRSEAEEFSLSFRSSVCQSPVPSLKPSDPVNNFRGPKQQELVKFRKLIEQGKAQDFRDIVNSNPKYLVSSGDTPVILQEGFRYNAMHVAAKENKHEICRLIIETLESDEFWQNFLQSHFEKHSTTSINNKRKQFLVDLYLNTPDKGNFETPLHFACKFGHVDVVEYLVCHPLTNTSSLNKYGESPEQIACSRCSCRTSAVKLEERIKHLLQDNVFVPVFGSEDNVAPSKLGQPWSLNMSQGERMVPSCPGVLHSPVESGIAVRAYAGPMSPSKAAEFHHLWKTPPSSQKERKRYTDIKRGDSTRGIERIGRSLAHDHGVAWAEYWSFLGCFADLAKPAGLDKLEEYLSKRQGMMLSSHTTSFITSNNFSKTANGQDLPRTPASGRSEVFITGSEQGSPLEAAKERKTLNSENSPTFQDGFPKSKHSSTETKLPFPSSTSPENATCQENSLVQNCNQDTLFRSSVNRDQSDPLNLVIDFSKLSISLEKSEHQSSIEGSLSEMSSLAETPDNKGLMSPNAETVEDDFLSCKKNLFGELLEWGLVDKGSNDLSFKSTSKLGTSCIEPSSLKEETLEPSSSPVPESQVTENRSISTESRDVSQRATPDGVQDEISLPKSELPEEDLTKQMDRLHLSIGTNTSSLDQDGNIASTSSEESADLDCKDGGTKQMDRLHLSIGTNTSSLAQDGNIASTSSEESADLDCKDGGTDIRSSSFSNRDLGLRKRDMNIFIKGFHPSKLDLDVLRAVSCEQIDRDRYPLVTQWRDTVKSYSAGVRDSWPSPGSPRFRTRHMSMPTWSC